VIGPDASGVKTIIDYRQKEDGSKVRRARHSRERAGTPSTLKNKFSPRERRSRIFLSSLFLHALLLTSSATSLLSSVKRPAQVRTVKKVRVQTTTKKVTKEMLARQSWAKFGDAQRYKPGDEVGLYKFNPVYP
jgi:hypothetical protein